MAEKLSRNYFRLEYPKEARPQIEIRHTHYQVINLSERGVKFVFNSERQSLPAALEEDIDATIVFEDRSRAHVSGKILRIDSDALVLELSEGVPLQRIMSEQRLLLNRFGNLKRPFER